MSKNNRKHKKETRKEKKEGSDLSNDPLLLIKYGPPKWWAGLVLVIILAILVFTCIYLVRWK